jgi:serine/threonine-protein kinase
MAPEQLEGASADERADLYALGIILFLMLASRLPFEGETAGEVLQKVMKEEAPYLGSLRPTLPLALSDGVARCLRKDRDERYRNARGLLTAVEAIQVEVEGSCPPGLDELP